MKLAGEIWWEDFGMPILLINKYTFIYTVILSQNRCRVGKQMFIFQENLGADSFEMPPKLFHGFCFDPLLGKRKVGSAQGTPNATETAATRRQLIVVLSILQRWRLERVIIEGWCSPLPSISVTNSNPNLKCNFSLQLLVGGFPNIQI